jgi:mitochondrial import receptor subunit TOM40
MMAANSFAQKDAQPTTDAPEKLTAYSFFNPLSPFHNVYNRFARWRADLDLPQPGTIENLQKEIKGIVLSVPWPSFAQL